MLAEIAIAGGGFLLGINTYRRRQKHISLGDALRPEIVSSTNQEKIATQEEHYRGDLRKYSQAEKLIDRMLVISSVSLGFSILGPLVYPPLALLSIPYILYIVYFFWVDAYKSLKKGVVGVSFISGLTMLSCVMLGYYMPGNLTGFLFALSRKFLLRIKDSSEKGFIDVFQQQPKSVWLLVDGVEVETDFDILNPGDVVLVHTGEMIPIDGKVVAGIASVDQRILTGEAQPVEKEVGDQVFASTVVLSGKLHIEVEKAGSETTVAQIGSILNQTINFKADMQLRAEQLADRTVIPFLVASGLTLPILGPIPAIAVLNSHIGYRMAFVAPLSILSFFRILSQKGILVKDGQALDQLALVDTVVFDKTGTLTLEQPHVAAIHSCSTYAAEQILVYAATAEGKQRHPIALAIVAEAQTRQLPLLKLDNAQYEVGYGLKVTIDQHLVRVGSNRFMEKEEITIAQEILAIQDRCHQQGHSLVMVAVNDTLAGAIELQPTIRPEAKAIVQGLRARGITSTYIISGDHETPTRRLASELGIDHYFAQTLPQNKAALIEQLQAAGKTVCFVGDGINDSIALAKATVSISLSGASTVAQDAAQIILLNGGLDELCELFDIAQEYEANMKSNFWAVIVPSFLCIGGVYFAHFGVVTTILLKQLGLFAGMVSALSPLRGHRQELALNSNHTPRIDLETSRSPQS